MTNAPTGTGENVPYLPNMHTITGGIKFEKGKDLPLKIKNFISKNGINLPFNPKNFRYSNTKLDNFLVAKDKKTGQKFKFNRLNNLNVEALTI